MLFHFFTSLIEQYSFFNVFKYLTFRTGLSVITSLLGKIPNKETYLSYFKKINKDKDKIFNYLNFDKLSEYKK